MSKQQMIPEWVGSTLTNGAFLDYAENVRDVYVGVGLEEINLAAVGAQLIAAVDKLHAAIKRQSAYDETVAVARADGDRDALATSFYHAWYHLCQLAPTHPLAPHVETLRSEMNAYKGVWSHELAKETSEIEGWPAALATDANRAALSALGLDKIAAALWAANDAAREAIRARRDETGEREAEKAEGTTPELRKAVANLLVTASQRVNAVAMLDPENAKAAEAIEKVTGIIKDLKRVASETKHRKGDSPDPEPEPTPEPTLEPNGDAAAS